MADVPVYQSSLPWEPTRPDTVIISCVDGRWRHHVQDFAQHYLKADAHADVLAVPGGIEPLTLFDLVPKDFNFLRRRLEALVRAHGTHRIVAIAHQDCAWYRERKLGPFKLDLKEQQLVDLKRAAARLRELFPGMAVETYFARLNGSSPASVVFDAV
jgi:hypothetical protein